MMKAKRKRIGSFLCFFKPHIMDDDNDPDGYGESSPETRIRRRSISGRFLSRFSRSKSSTTKPMDGSGESPKDSNRQILSKTMRSISSNPSSRDGKLPRKVSSRSLTRKESRQESFAKSSQDESASFSVSSSSSCSSCLSIPSSSVLYPTVTKSTPLPSPVISNYGYATGLYFVLLSLCVMVFCGRVPAVLWTATWLCFVPRRRKKGTNDVTTTAAEVPVEPAGRRMVEEEKTRVVLEGFLQRNRKI